MDTKILLGFLFVLIGATGIALATALTGWINVTLLATELKRRGEFALDATFRRAIVGIVLATVAMSAVLWWLASSLNPWFAPERGLLVQVLALLALICGGLLAYLAVGTLAGALKPRTLLKDLLGR